MFEGVVKSLGVGRFLDWRALEASGSVGGVLICWDKRCLRESMALSPKRIERAYGRNLGQLKEFGENPGV
ncbi:hypothetical protein CK203_039349 [Vitis vinifera]|uniref:Uncharacterized protein n=1 Tax=Vitis vinifera TaxID=29760 RepID=A0A438HGQ5_VITVI|nr:hypothetical protein CK203_039349 [Vitis vinifera]